MASEASLIIYPYPLINPTITGNGYTLTPSVGNNCYIFDGIPIGTWTVLADGYNSSTVTVTGTSYTDSYSVTLTVAAQNISKLSIDGSTYEIKDATARTSISNLATVATTGSYNDLTNKPTIPTVNNATLTIQKNGSNVATFTANASNNVTANISVPNTVSSVSSSSTNADAVGAKLFYDTVGDIEAALHAINSGGE